MTRQEKEILRKLHNRAARLIELKAQQKMSKRHGYWVWYESKGSIIKMDTYSKAITWDSIYIGMDFGEFEPYFKKDMYGRLLKFLMLDYL